eukprot:3971681-Prymnesium_polylepis.1
MNVTSASPLMLWSSLKRGTAAKRDPSASLAVDPHQSFGIPLSASSAPAALDERSSSDKTTEFEPRVARSPAEVASRSP